MKDVDELLRRAAGARPARELDGDFTKRVIGYVTEHPRPAGWWLRLRERLQTGFAHKPAAVMLGVAALIAVGGTGYAAIANWPTVTTRPNGHYDLQSGNRIIGVDAANCNYFKGVDGQPFVSSDDKVYYEIKKDSKLTDQQVTDMVRGICEENLSNNAVAAAMKPFAGRHLQLASTDASQITAISGSGITVTLDPHYNVTHHQDKGPLTFTQFAPDVAVYDDMTPISFKELKPGDTVKMVLIDRRPDSSDASTSFADTGLLTVQVLVRVPPLTGTPDVFYEHLGSDFVRTELCATNPTGFCRAYEFPQTVTPK